MSRTRRSNFNGIRETTKRGPLCGNFDREMETGVTGTTRRRQRSISLSRGRRVASCPGSGETEFGDNGQSEWRWRSRERLDTRLKATGISTQALPVPYPTGTTTGVHVHSRNSKTLPPSRSIVAIRACQRNPLSPPIVSNLFDVRGSRLPRRCISIPSP